MDLIQTDYPEQYRIYYDNNTHTFEILATTNVIRHLRQHIAELEMATTDHSIPSRIDTEPFINDSNRWGFGGCMEIDDTPTAPIAVIRCQLNRQKQNNIAKTFAALLEELNRIVYAEEEIVSADTSRPMQFATIQTIIQADELHWNCSIGSSMSKRARRTIERLFSSSDEEERSFFFEAVILAMEDAFLFLHQDERNVQRNTLRDVGPNGAVSDLLCATFIPPWRIKLECVGASLSINPQYNEAGENRGAQWEPHNVDSTDCQLTLLAGLCALYRQLNG